MAEKSVDDVLGPPPQASPTVEHLLGPDPARSGGLLSDIKRGYGNKTLTELWTSESLPANIWKGVKRVAGGGSVFKHDPNAPGTKESLQALRDLAEEHPGVVLGSLAKSIVSDPELLIPVVGWEGLAGKAALGAIDAARAAGLSVKAAGTVGKLAGKATQVGTAAGIGTTVEAGRQFGEGKYSFSELGTAALESSPIGLLGRGPKTAQGALSALATRIKQAAIASTAGAAVGYSFSSDEHKTRGAVIGAAVGALPLTKRVRGVDISEFGKTRNGELQAYARRVYQSMKWIEEMIPDKARREALSRHIDDPITHGLQGNEATVAKYVRQFFDDLGQAGLSEGVLKGLRNNYVPHIIGDDPALQSHAKAILDKLFGFDQGTGMGGGRRFAKGRKYPTFAELNQALQGSGLKLKTTDISELVGIYSQSMFRSIMDRRMANAIKATLLPNGQPLVMHTDKAPDDYRVIESPHLNGMRVHPEIADDVRFLLTARDPNAMTAKLSKVAVAAKRLSVSMSLFHAKSLFDAYVGARGLGSMTIKRAVDGALKMYREGGNNDDVDALLKNGLMVGRPEDVGSRSLFQALGDINATLNNIVNMPGLKQLGQLEHGLNQFTFGYLQTGMKISTALMEMERLIGKGVPREDAARMASSYSNDIFGGLDWYRVATDTQSGVLRTMLMSAAGQRGRPMMQLLMFAPDWTFATIRAAAKALPGFAEKEVSQMHRKYMLKAAMYYLIVANGINMWQTGHSLFQNRDPTRIELKDGRTMQFSKHFMEPMQWLRDPETTAENKGAFPVRLALDIHDRNQAEKMHRKAPPGSFEQDVLQTLLPFSIKNMVENGFTAEDMLSTVGMPVYGKPRR
jgi:hypothetical protein